MFRSLVPLYFSRILFDPTFSEDVVTVVLLPDVQLRPDAYIK